MRLDEVGTPFDQQRHDMQVEWLNHQIGEGRWAWSNDGTVFVDGDAMIVVKRGTHTKLPVKFGHITGNFDVNGIGLTSFEGFPYKAMMIMADGNDFTSFDGLLIKEADSFSCSHSQIFSLKGVHKHIKNVPWLDFGQINEAILGLMMIPGLEHVELLPANIANIINTALKMKKDIHQVQDYLLDAGLDQYAKM